ncbi:protein kinase [Streptomyces sp. NPDC005438]|uniref:protein kinase n=1 Tax=Streptomyces sp. NPDC005438 TaxID=3156880 RepID=UPI0033BD6BBF
MRLLADRYRLSLTSAEEEEWEFLVWPAFDTASGQDVLITQVPLPEVVEGEVLDDSGWGHSRATRRPADPAIRRAVDAALAAARLPDHPRRDQVFDVFVEDEGLWIVSELVPAQSLAELLEEEPLSPHRAAEIGSDVLAALRVLHEQGWTHRNITADTVLICEDGRALLTGLAVAAAQEALCGYDPLPPPGGRQGEAPPPEYPELPLPPRYERADSTPAPPRSLEGPPAPRRPELEEGGGWEAHHLRPAAPEGTPAHQDEYQRERYVAGFGLSGSGEAGPSVLPEDGGRGSYAIRPHTPDRMPQHGRHYQDEDEKWELGPGEEAIDELEEPDRDWPPLSAPPPSPQPEPHPTAYQHVDPEGAPRAGYASVAGWDPAGEESRYRGPATALEAERARQARLTLVGAVTERWAPEQAGPVYQNWRLAPPVGPPADLWALGVLLFRAVQGHAPYPEDDAAELAQMVCAEPPAFAEECGPLRPVVESLLRQDATERPDLEELRGWLRSLVRSAPEPGVGQHTVLTPPHSLGSAPHDPRRLPIKRPRFELVRRRRAARAERKAERRAAAPPPPEPRRSREEAASGRGPRHLGRWLVGLVMLALVAAVAFVTLFLPEGDTGNQRGSVNPDNSSEGSSGGSGDEPSAQPSHKAPPGYQTRRDPSGFQIAVPQGWQKKGKNSRGQVRFLGDGLELTVVPGRDSAKRFGQVPADYQREKEPELADFRSADWAETGKQREITVGSTPMAQGAFSWGNGALRSYLRNRAVLIDGRYHLVIVRGELSDRKRIDERFDALVDTYQYTGKAD